MIFYSGDLEENSQSGVEAMRMCLGKAGFELEPSFSWVYLETMRAYYQRRNEELRETPAVDLLRQVLAGFGFSTITEAQALDALDEYYAHHQACWHGEEDAVSTLAELRRMGLRLGLVSNAVYDRDIQVLVDQAGLRPYFDFVISSAACGWRKPHAHIFDLALTALDALPGQTVMVGDLLETDILGANRMGIRSVWITRRASADKARVKAAETQAGEYHPGRVICTLAELPALLAAWGAGS